MTILVILIPVSLAIGALWLGAFVWALRARQFDDLEGDRHRILTDTYDEAPKPGDKTDGPSQ